MEVKQVIVVRKDLNMRKGKIAAQVAHASMKIFFDRMVINKNIQTSIFRDEVQGVISPLTPAMLEWMNHGLFTKIVVSVDSEHELFEIKAKADRAGIPTALITDAGKTEFDGVPTNTCVAIGPDDSEKIDAITGDLKLL